MLEAVAGARAELLDGPLRSGDADHGDVQGAATDQRLQRRKDLLVREIAGGPEDDEGVRAQRGAHGRFSWWPPNSKRIAEITRLAKSCSPREAKRSLMAVERIGAGTLSSMAA